jgi:hypothetical protein
MYVSIYPWYCTSRWTVCSTVEQRTSVVQGQVLLLYRYLIMLLVSIRGVLSSSSTRQHQTCSTNPTQYRRFIRLYCRSLELGNGICRYALVRIETKTSNAGEKDSCTFYGHGDTNLNRWNERASRSENEMLDTSHQLHPKNQCTGPPWRTPRLSTC